MAKNDAGDTTKKPAKSGNQGSNNGGTRASQILVEMPAFQEQIETINDRWETYEKKGQEALDLLIDIGQNLSEVHAWLDHRNEDAQKQRDIAWEQWCKDNLPFGKRQANRYIRIFENKSKIKFTENEKVSVRAALELIVGGNGKNKKKTKVMAKGNGQLKAKIEAIPVCNASGNIKGHKVRLAWCDDEIGKLLYKQGKQKVSPDDTDTIAGACARLFALALNDKHGDVGKRFCRAIRDIPDSCRDDEDAMTAIAKVVECRGAVLQPSIPNGGYPGTGLTGPMGPSGPMR